MVLRKLIPALESGNASVQVTPQPKRITKSYATGHTQKPILPNPTDATLHMRLEDIWRAGYLESFLRSPAEKSEIAST